MSVKVFICYKLNIPEDVMDDLEQEVYNSLSPDGTLQEVKAEVFIQPDTYPALKKYLEVYGKTGDVKLFLEANLTA